jgi:hypothetical protein
MALILTLIKMKNRLINFPTFFIFIHVFFYFNFIACKRVGL